MEYTILLLTQNLDKLERAYTVFVQNGSVKKNSNVAITNVKLREELKKAIEILQASTDQSKLLLADVSKAKRTFCKHEWIMTADSFDQTCYCKKCGKSS